MTDGKDSKYVMLISWDGHTFYVKRSTTQVSGTLKAMLQGPQPYAETADNKIHFKSISSGVLGCAGVK